MSLEFGKGDHLLAGVARRQARVVVVVVCPETAKST